MKTVEVKIKFSYKNNYYEMECGYHAGYPGTRWDPPEPDEVHDCTFITPAGMEQALEDSLWEDDEFYETVLNHARAEVERQEAEFRKAHEEALIEDTELQESEAQKEAEEEEDDFLYKRDRSQF